MGHNLSLVIAVYIRIENKIIKGQGHMSLINRNIQIGTVIEDSDNTR